MTYLLFKGQEIRLMGKELTFLMKSKVGFVPNITKPGSDSVFVTILANANSSVFAPLTTMLTF